MIKRIAEEISSFDRSERLFILFAMLCGFFICAEYSIIRPVSNALVITCFGSQAFPYAWLAVVPLNLAVVALYNKFLPRLGCFSLFLWIIGTVTTVNLSCALLLPYYPSLSFFFYIWKEIYVMLMFQQLWSVIHSTISFKRAKYLYGIFFALGSVGATLGSLLPGFFAVAMGSERLLYATLPIYSLLALCYFKALKHTSANILPEKEPSRSAFFHGIKLIRASRYLTFILAIVVFMQFSSSLIEYLFNCFLEEAIQVKDLRTQYVGRIFGLVHGITIALQLGGAFLLIHFLGMRRSHLLIPLLLGFNGIAFALFPLFGVISFAFTSIKALDFSLFGIIKEMLYIPLKPEEKFQAKAFIDIFAYRSSKAFASLLILGLPASSLNAMGIALFASWALLVAYMLKGREEEFAR